MAPSKRLTVFTAAVVFLVTLAAAQTYRITDLGTFSGGTVSEGYGVNILGEVAGYSRFADFNAHGFFWTQQNGLVDLGSIPPQKNFSAAMAINALGVVAGYSDYNQYLQEHAVYWSHGKLYDWERFREEVPARRTGLTMWARSPAFPIALEMRRTRSYG